MKHLAILLLMLPFYASASENLTAKQREEVERIFEERAIKLRSVVIEEVKRNPSLLQESAEAKTTDVMKPAATAANSIEENPDNYIVYSTNLSKAPVPLDRGFSGENLGDRTFKASVDFNQGAGRASMRFSETRDELVESSSIIGRAISTDITVSSPIDDKEGGFANFATLDGLSSGFKVEYSRNSRHVNILRTLEKYKGKEFDRYCETYVTDGNFNCSKSDILRALNGNERELLEFKKNFYPWVIERSYGLQASYDEFSYLTPSISKKSKSEVGYGASFSIGFLAPSRETLFAVGAQYQKTYKSAKQAILCPATSASSTIVCTSGALGAPVETTRELLWGEVRGSAKLFGYSLRLTHDFESGETGADLPVYLIKNPKGAWSGGVRFGWTDKQDFGVGIFLSAPFEL